MMTILLALHNIVCVQIRFTTLSPGSFTTLFEQKSIPLVRVPHNDFSVVIPNIFRIFGYGTVAQLPLC